MKRINSNSMSYLWNLVFYYYFQYFLIFESIFTTEMRFWMLVFIFKSKSAHKWIKTISIACLHVYLHGGCTEIIFQLTYLTFLSFSLSILQLLDWDRASLHYVLRVDHISVFFTRILSPSLGYWTGHFIHFQFSRYWLGCSDRHLIHFLLWLFLLN